MAERRFARKLMLALLAALAASMTGTRAGWDELLFAPNLSNVPLSQFSATEPKSSDVTREDSNAMPWMRLPPGAPTLGLPWHTFGADYRGDIGASDKFRDFGDASSTIGSTNDQLRVGNSYLGIQTEKALDGLERFRRTDCTTDEECEEYSGLPKSGRSMKGIKNLRKPFFGLSITTPLH